MTVRRRGGLMALVAVVALVVAAGYLWRFSETQSEVALLLGVALGLVAVAFGCAWGDARTPLLVADETGLRVRLGRDWTGVPWGQVQRVEVGDRGRVRDGHVAVLTTSGAAAALDGASLRSRVAAMLNRWLYDAPFVVPFGPTTTVSVVDVRATLTRLAAGRAPVVAVDLVEAEPQPTVEITTTGPEESEVDRATAHRDPADVGVESVDGDPLDPAHPADPADVDAESGDGDRLDPADVDAESGDGDRLDPPDVAADSAEPTQEPSRRPGLAPERPVVAARVVSAFRSRPARRAEVTVPYTPEPATMGMLALSDPLGRGSQRELPEAAQLRYLADEVAPQPVIDAEAADRSNIALIIDATTDMSKRAMSKVRRPATDHVVADEAAEGDAAPAESLAESTPLLIGGELARARQQLGLTVDDLAERTRIRPSVIEALEVDDFGPCGGDFYARGHLRMLARVLGVDADELLTTYDTHIATNPVSPRQVFEVELASGTTGMVRGTRGGSRWGGLIATVLVLMLVWGVAQYFLGDTRRASGDGSAVPQNSAGLGSPGVGNPPVVEPIESHVKVSAVGGDTRVVVRDRFKVVVFDGVLKDGKARKFVGESPLRVMATDGGVIELSVKGRSRGLMGDPGERSRAQIKAVPDRGSATRQGSDADRETSNDR